MAHPHDSRIRPADDLEVDVLEAVAENQILAVVSFAPPRLKARVAQPGDDGPLLVAKHSTPDGRAARACRWKGVVDPEAAPGPDGRPVYLAPDGGFTASRPKSKARVVGHEIDGAVLLLW